VLELELDKLQVTEAAAAVFKELADKAAAQLHQLMQQQQQHMASLLPSRPATAAGAAVSSSGLQDAPQSSSSGGAAAADSVSGGTSSSSTSGSTAQGSLQLPVAPLLAIRYHLEASKPDGERCDSDGRKRHSGTWCAVMQFSLHSPALCNCGKFPHAVCAMHLDACRVWPVQCCDRGAPPCAVSC
jgi:hypothetical protein